MTACIAIVSFVQRVATPGGTGYVPPAERIAVFDNDGTLWGEQPKYVQLLFAIDRVKALASKHPEWKRQEPFAAGNSAEAAQILCEAIAAKPAMSDPYLLLGEMYESGGLRLEAARVYREAVGNENLSSRDRSWFEQKSRDTGR